ncbi:hypothetical protein MTO96_002768 [Rhipicephalus appendiculatus]
MLQSPRSPLPAKPGRDPLEFSHHSFFFLRFSSLLFLLGSEPKRRSDRSQKRISERRASEKQQPRRAPIVGGDEDATRLNSPFVFVEYSPSAASSDSADFVRPFRWMGSSPAHASPRSSLPAGFQ